MGFRNNGRVNPFLRSNRTVQSLIYKYENQRISIFDFTNIWYTNIWNGSINYFKICI